MTSSPILAFADATLPHELHIDGSRQALGAVLYQIQDGKPRVIGYGSRSLNKAESNYAAHKIEFLALKWAVCEKFHDYLYGAKFTVFTDNNPLTYVLTSAKLDATGHRWLAALAAYDFDIKYKPGKANVDADAMSRLPSTISTDSIQALSQVHSPTPWIQAFTLQTSPPVVDTAEMSKSFNSWKCQNWREAQRHDSAIGPLLRCLLRKEIPSKQMLPAVSLPLLRQMDKLVVLDGALYRKCMLNDENVNQIVLPTSLQKEVLSALHNDMGHPGRDRTLQLIRQRFFWPQMISDVENYVKGCHRCVLRKKSAESVPIVPIETSQPLEVLSLDHLSLETSKGGYSYILVMTDMFTRYAVAVPVKSLSANTTAKALFENFVVHYGIPFRIHSDQGGAFQSKVLKELCKLLGMAKSRSSIYHPEGNGLTERFNRTLLGMLGTLSPEQKEDWKSMVGPIVHAYNCTPQTSTGYSPYYLMFGRYPNLPIDVVMDLGRREESAELPTYIHQVRKKLLSAYELARKSSGIAKAKQKKYKDPRCAPAVLQVGDRVLVKKLAFTGKHKLDNRWEPEIYTVVKQPNEDIPVYQVVVEGTNKGEKKRIRTLHRCHLLPVGDLLLSDSTAKAVPVSSANEVAVASEESDSRESDSSDVEDHCHNDSQDIAVVSRDGDTVAEIDRGSVTDSQSDNNIIVGSSRIVPKVERPTVDSSPVLVTKCEPTTVPKCEPTTMESDEDSEEELRNSRRYPARQRKPPDRFQVGVSMSQVSRANERLAIIHKLVELMSKD